MNINVGEMDPKELWDTTLNPYTRSLTRLVVEDDEVVSETVATLMEQSEQARIKRRKLIKDSVHLFDMDNLV